MEDKYIKFYATFHKKFKNGENLMLSSKTLSDRGVTSNSILRTLSIDILYVNR
jgi:hypothetical protein